MDNRPRQDRHEGLAAATAADSAGSEGAQCEGNNLVDLAERLPEVVLVMLTFCSAHSIAHLKRTCTALRDITKDPEVYKQIVLHAYRYLPSQSHYDALAKYETWENMWFTRPRVRLDGVFVVSFSLIKYGTPMGRGMQESGVDFYKPVFHVVHSRYVRFYPDGTFITMLTAENPRHALKALAAARAGKPGSCGVGTFVQNGDKIQCNFEVKLETHPRMQPIQQSFYLQIASTKRGAWNRLRWLEFSQFNMDGTVHSHAVPDQPLRLAGFDGFTDKVNALICDTKMLNSHIQRRAKVTLA